MQFFSVKDFEKLQHYKDRSPPWIKLYYEILDSYEFAQLPDASKWHLLASMLLASRSTNKIPFDSDWIAKRINATEKVDLNLLVKSGFILLDQPLHDAEHDASKTLAKCLPREEKRREETEKNGAEAPTDLFVTKVTEEKQYFDRSKEVLGPKANGMAAKLLKSKGRITAAARSVIETASTKSDPLQYVAAVVHASQKAPQTQDDDSW